MISKFYPDARAECQDLKCTFAHAWQNTHGGGYVSEATALQHQKAPGQAALLWKRVHVFIMQINLVAPLTYQIYAVPLMITTAKLIEMWRDQAYNQSGVADIDTPEIRLLFEDLAEPPNRFVAYEETVHLDRHASSLIHNHIQGPSVLRATLQTTLIPPLIDLINGYFGEDVTHIVYQALWEKRYKRRVYPQLNLWPQEVLPTIKEALK